ncbi:MAG: hypothetical protein KKC01_08785 [Gammaproteobacteria bacterium]|nr:hypothetical protein [Gammaproteobacteria bacterium]
MLQPSQFTPNQAWLLFKLNQVPISTGADGEFDVIALMDAASLFILGSEFVPAGTLDTAVAELRNLMESAYAQHKAWPKKLYAPQTMPVAKLAAELKAWGMAAVVVKEAELKTFTREAQRGFNAHFGG